MTIKCPRQTSWAVHKSIKESRSAAPHEQNTKATKVAKPIRGNRPDESFSLEETTRRAMEVIRRGAGHRATFDLSTGQSMSNAKLSEDELKERGYPCIPWWNK